MNAAQPTVKRSVRALAAEKPVTWTVACASRAQKKMAADATVTESDIPAASLLGLPQRSPSAPPGGDNPPGAPHTNIFAPPAVLQRDQAPTPARLVHHQRRDHGGAGVHRSPDPGRGAGAGPRVLLGQRES